MQDCSLPSTNQQLLHYYFKSLIDTNCEDSRLRMLKKFLLTFHIYSRIRNIVLL